MRWPLPLLALLALTGCAGKEATLRLRDLGSHLGEQVTVEGRTGNIRDDLEVPDRRVFTLRDEHGDLTLVRWRRPSYPPRFWGTTQRIVGTPRREQGHLFLDARTVRPANVPYWTYATAAASVLAAAIALLVLDRFRRAPSRLSPIWAYLEVRADGSKEWYPLRREETPIGREVDPDHGLRLFSGDPSVSRKHGKIVREGDHAYYEDTGSRCGSRVNGETVAPGQQAPLRHGTRIEMGNKKDRSTMVFLVGKEPATTYAAGEDAASPDPAAEQGRPGTPTV